MKRCRIPSRPLAGWLVVPLLLAAAPAAAPPRPATAAVTPAAACKPLPPLEITAERGDAVQADLWTLHLRNHVAARTVEVTLATRGPQGTLDRRVVWRGRLEAGESRDLTATYRPAAGGMQVWASVRDVDVAWTQRRDAVVPLLSGAAAPALAPRGVLRVTPDGERIFEYVAPSQGGR